MIKIDSDSGLIRFLGFSIHWANQHDSFGLPGYFCIGFKDYSLEFGEIDMGNGIFLVKYADGDVDLVKTFLELPQ